MAVLRIRSPLVGREERLFEWDGHPITIGRDAACDVVLLEQTASRRHARLERRGAEVVLDARGRDGSGGNGVWVDDERVETKTLQDGETFRIGRTTIQLVLDPFSMPTITETDPPSSELSPEAIETNAASVTGPPPSATAPPPDAPAPRPRPPAPSPSAPAIGVSPIPTPKLSEPPADDAPRVASASRSAAEAPRSGAYSLGVTGDSNDTGPETLGPMPPSAASVYSMGRPTPSDPRDASTSDAYRLGSPTMSDSGPRDLGSGFGSSASVYSLGDADPGAPSFVPHASSAPSAYSLGDAPPDPDSGAPSFVPPASSAPSAYSLGDALPAESRGPDTPVDPPPRHEPRSSAELGRAPPPPASLAAPAPVPRPVADPGGIQSSGHRSSAPSAYSMGDLADPAAPVAWSSGHHRPSAPSNYSLGNAAPAAGRGPDTPAPPSVAAGPAAHTSWEWADADIDRGRARPRTAGSMMWLGLGLVIGGLVAMAVTLAMGYDPRELLSSVSIGGSP